MTDVRTQAVSGVIPPITAEAIIRERWPSVARFPSVASLGRVLTRTIVLAPVAWLLMGPFYFLKILPVFARRYRLTNKRVAILGGWSCKTIAEVKLVDIDDVRLRTDDNCDFFRAATVEILSGDKVVLELPGTPDPNPFRVAILDARDAWAPGKAKLHPFIAASVK